MQAHAVYDHDFAKYPLRAIGDAQSHLDPRKYDSRALHRRVDVEYNGWWMCLGALAAMAVLIGVLTLTETPPTPADLSASVWAHWGRSRWYLPAILPIVAAAWMWMSDPRRIVANAERITELSDTLAESITEKARAVQENRGLKSPGGNEDGPETGVATECDDSSRDDQ